MQPRVAIIYLSYNSVPYLPEVLDSWEKLEAKEEVEIYIIDNVSTDGSQKWIRDHILPKSEQTLPKVIYIENETNDGFAGGNNIAMQQAIDAGAEYVFLQNNDLKLHPKAIQESLALADTDPQIGSIQSLMLLWQDETRVNSTGGMVHFLGFGFVRDNGSTREGISVRDGEDIAYASGAAVLYRASVLKEVGLLDTHFFMYHEDLDLGWRIRLAGYRNVLSLKSVTYHRYEFSRSVKKLFWMETNRWLVHLSLLKPATLILIAPLMVLMEIPLALFALKGGWLHQKIRVWGNILLPKTWLYIAKKRREANRIRKVGDKEIVRYWTGKIQHQETDNVIVNKIGNPLLSGLWSFLKKLIIW